MQKITTNYYNTADGKREVIQKSGYLYTGRLQDGKQRNFCIAKNKPTHTPGNNRTWFEVVDIESSMPIGNGFYKLSEAVNLAERACAEIPPKTWQEKTAYWVARQNELSI